MNRRLFSKVLVIAGLTSWWPRKAEAKPVRAFKLRQLRLYQPEDVLAARVDVESLATSAKEIQQSFEKLTAGAWSPEVKGVLIAVAIRSGRRQRIWCELVGKHAPGEADKLEVELSKTSACDVEDLVSYALEYARDGKQAALPMIPSSWQVVAEQAGRAILIPDDAVAALWPEAVQQAVAPDGRSPPAPAER